MIEIVKVVIAERALDLSHDAIKNIVFRLRELGSRRHDIEFKEVGYEEILLCFMRNVEVETGRRDVGSEGTYARRRLGEVIRRRTNARPVGSAATHQVLCPECLEELDADPRVLA